MHKEKINKRLEADLISNFKHQIGLDKNGRAVIDKSKPIKNNSLKRRMVEDMSGESKIDDQQGKQKVDTSKNNDVTSEATQDNSSPNSAQS